MSSFIVDASVAIKWLVDEPGADAAALLLDHPLAAPDLIGPECANVLWKKVMRAELSAPEAEAMGAALEKADIVLHPTRRHWQAAVAVACALRHPAYDCIYLCRPKPSPSRWSLPMRGWRIGCGRRHWRALPTL